MTAGTKENVVVGSSIEFITLDEKSSVNAWNNVPAIGISEEGGQFVTVTFELPSDRSASAVLFALIGGADLSTILSHRSDENGEVYMTIKHNVNRVYSWEIKSDVASPKASVSVVYDVDSSILIGDQEVTRLG